MRPVTIVLAAAVLVWTPAAAGDDAPFDLSFDGGSAADYLTVVRKAVPDANIVQHSDVALATLPPIDLRSVTLPSALRLLDGHQAMASGRQVVLKVDMQQHPQSAPIYQVLAYASPADDPPATLVLSVASLLGPDLSADDLLGAIETALGVISKGAAPTLKFHEPTGLLIGEGTAAQIRTIQEVISQLGTWAHERDRSRIEQTEARDTVNRMRKQVDTLETELVATTRALTEARSRLEIAQRETADARDAIREAVEWQTRGKLIDAENARLNSRLEEAEQTLQDTMRDHNERQSELQNRLRQVEMEVAARETRINDLMTELAAARSGG